METLVDALSRSIPAEVKTICRTFEAAGHRAWVVGGSVRDVVRAVLAGQEPNVFGDWDLASDARPEQTQKLFRKVIPTGIQHGTVTVVLNKQHFEITTLRGEKGHTDGRRPDEVYFVDDLREDLARRDFTVNAMAFDVAKGEFSDPFSGIEDLKDGLIRAVGDPARRFSEDGLRVLRCARFCATLGLAIEKETQAAIVPSLLSFEKVAQERVADEWFKALKSPAPSRFFRAIKEHEMLRITFPQLWSTDDTALPFEEVLSRIDIPDLTPELRLALFVRAGMPTQEEPARFAQAFATRLRLSREDTARLSRLCQHGLLPDVVRDKPGDYEARKWLALVGRKEADEVLVFQTLLRPLGTDEKLQRKCHEELRRQLASGCALSLKELAVTGGDLMQKAQIEKGPLLGQVLAQLLDAVLHDPKLNTPETLLELAKTS